MNQQQANRVGVLITNLGTPDAPNTKALRKYLREFLSDPRVVQIPRFIWWFILNLLVLPFRPKKSAKLYASIWTDRGSPLLFHTEDICTALSEQLNTDGSHLIIDFAMRYGANSFQQKVDAMLTKGITHLLVIPLYPQYSATTTASTLDKISEVFNHTKTKPELRFVNDYHDFPAYITACSEHIKHHQKSNKLVFSYHGLPQSFVDKGDPYYDQCLQTTALIAAELNLNQDDISTTFQSRFGKAEWLKPYTETTLKSLPRQDIKSVDIFCPGFSADCLETLEEIVNENKQYFQQSGGREFHYIPALNAESCHIHALTQLIKVNLQDWDFSTQ